MGEEEMKYPLFYYLFGFEYVLASGHDFDHRIKRVIRAGKLLFVKHYGDRYLLREKGRIEPGRYSLVKSWIPLTPNTERFWNEGYLLQTTPRRKKKHNEEV